MKLKKGLRKSLAAVLALSMTLAMIPFVYADGEGGSSTKTEYKLALNSAAADANQGNYTVGLNGGTEEDGTAAKPYAVNVTEQYYIAGRAAKVTMVLDKDSQIPDTAELKIETVTETEVPVVTDDPSVVTPDEGAKTSETKTETTYKELEESKVNVVNDTVEITVPLPEVADDDFNKPAEGSDLYKLTYTWAEKVTEEDGDDENDGDEGADDSTTKTLEPTEVIKTAEMYVQMNTKAVPLIQIIIEDTNTTLYRSNTGSAIYTHFIEKDEAGNETLKGYYTVPEEVTPEEPGDGSGDGDGNDGNGSDNGGNDNNGDGSGDGDGNGEGNDSGNGDGDPDEGGNDDDGNDDDTAGTENPPVTPAVALTTAASTTATTNDTTTTSKKAENTVILKELYDNLIKNNSTQGYSKEVPIRIVLNAKPNEELSKQLEQVTLLFKTSSSASMPILLSPVDDLTTEDVALYNVLNNIGLIEENAKAVSGKNVTFKNDDFTGYWGPPGGKKLTLTGSYPQTITDGWQSLASGGVLRFFTNVAETNILSVALVSLADIPNEDGSYGYSQITESTIDLSSRNYSSGGGSSTKYTITATAGANGSISPKSITLGHGGSHTFTITPDKGYEVDDVLVDGKSVGAVEKYTFSKVTANHTIKATFVKEGSKDKDKVSVSDFNDVKKSDWYYDAVDYATQNGLFAGTTKTTFSPNSNMTRAMFVAVLGRMADNMDIDTSGYNPNFNDVSRNSYYGSYVGWAAHNDIVAGYSSSTFAPDDNVTREQMAALFIRFAEYAKIDLKTSSSKTFTDSSKVSSWAVSDVNKAAAAGLITGYEDNSFRPQGTATRAEVCTVFMQFSKEYVDED